MRVDDNSAALEAIDAAVARLLAQVEALRTARVILAELGAPSPSTSLSDDVLRKVLASPEGTPAQAPPPSTVSRGRGRSRVTLELHEQLQMLMSQGVLSAAGLASRVGRPVQSVYQSLHDAGLSLRRAREDWQASRGALERGPDPVPPAPGEASPGPGQVAGLELGGVVFVRLDNPGAKPTYLRCAVSSLPDAAGKFAVRGPSGAEISLEVGDAVAPFRDYTPTFSLAPVEGGEEPGGSGEPDPAGEGGPEGVIGVPTSPGTGGAAAVTGAAPRGESRDSPAEERAATAPELRAEVIRRQRGCSGKAVRLATTVACGHSHVASVDRMGYGTTVEEASTHVHRVLRWEILPAAGAVGHSGQHVLTLVPPESEQRGSGK